MDLQDILQCMLAPAWRAQLLPHIRLFVPKCIAMNQRISMPQHGAPILKALVKHCNFPHRSILIFSKRMRPHLVNLSEGNEPERLLGRAGDVVPLLVGQTLRSIHRLFFARVQEAGRVWQENSSRKGFEHPAQRITWAKWHSCRVEHLE